MTAMGINRFVVTLRHAVEGKTEERHWSKDNVMHSMAWLKRMNASGYDVLIRPDGEHGLVLLDGVSKVQLTILRQRGFDPAVVVDIDREHYQIWIKLSDRPIAQRSRELAARSLLKEVGVFGKLEKRIPDGRLAGLANRGMTFQDNLYPYALVTEAAGKVAPAASSYLQKIQHEITDGVVLSEKHRNPSRGRSR